VLRWLDFMHDASLSVWQVLPLVIPDRSRSPYQSCSAFACNPALLPLDRPAVEVDRLQSFRTANAYWIEDFALFAALSERFNTDAWWSWPTEYARRDALALERFRGEASTRINSLITEQYLLDLRWREIRTAASERGIVLFGDMPIFVAHESGDVWAQPSNFLLDDEFQPRYVTGVPPDYFSATGQRWGNPHYDWQLMRESGFSWWRERMQRQFEWFDILRLDHFRALSAVWMIDASCDSAIEGVWRETPGHELLRTIQAAMGRLPIVPRILASLRMMCADCAVSSHYRAWRYCSSPSMVPTITRTGQRI
jgi:4-alpha-glucanotransferase